MIIEVNEREKYGRLLLYPMNEPARILAGLVNAKTLNLGHLHAVSKLGHEIKLLGLPLSDGLAEAIDQMNARIEK